MSDREKLIEAMARAMLADELTVRPAFTFDPAWQQGSGIWLSSAAAALAAIEAAGVRLVPSKATMKMQHAISVYHLPRNDGYGNYADLDIQLAARVIYTDMIAASPYAPGS